MPIDLAASQISSVKNQWVGSKLITSRRFRFCAFILDDIVAFFRLVKAVVGAFLATTVIGHGIVHFIVLCASVASFFALSTYICLEVYQHISLYLSDSLFDTSSDLYNFVSYVLNFSFLGSFFTLYYIAFCSIVVLYIALQVANFVSSIYPAVATMLRSSLNWMSGDS